MAKKKPKKAVKRAKGTKKPKPKGTKKARTVLKGKKDVDKFYDNLRETKNKHRSSGNFHSFEPGKTVCRPVPFKHDGADQLFAPDFKHFLKRGEEPVCCPIGEEVDATCAICATIPDDSRMKASRNWVAHFVIQSDPQGTDPGTLVTARCCKSVMEQIIDIVLDEDGIYRRKGIKNPLEHDFEIIKGREKRFPKYDVVLQKKKGGPVPGASPRDLQAIWDSKQKTEDELEEIASSL